MHCSILGTCLQHSDLLKISRKSGYTPDPQATEYQVHNFFVQRAGESGRPSRLMHKTLDTRYSTAIRTFQTAQSEEDLQVLWSDALNRGDVSGPFWALMSHPLLTDNLLAQAFGEVHMLSHLTGATHRKAVKRLRKMETALMDTQQRLENQSKEYQHRNRQHAMELAGLERRLQSSEQEVAVLQAANRQQSERQNGNTEHHYRRLEVNLQKAQRSEQRYQQRYDLLEQELAILRTAYEQASDHIKTLEKECLVLEATLCTRIEDPTETPSAPIDLCGRRIAYVGGRPGAIQNFQTLIENLNGTFLHHDGGVQDSIRCLNGVLHRADMVLCPIDCVSHGACLKAKSFCKQAAKPFIPLRTTGLSSLVSGLQQAMGESRSMKTD